ncbi:MFS transporter [Bradyrhizobium sp. INPA03-11B]|uniref:MFS transporter n=1 Tax=Bradyrhizobium sp. INPA03-11B TaxID=418598 RepID=UPI00338FC4B3
MKPSLAPLLGAVFWLLFGVALLAVGNGLFSTFFSLRMRIEGFSLDAIGVVMTGFYVGLALGTQFCDRFVEALGRVRAYAVFAAVITAAALGAALHVSPASWFMLRILLGFGFAGLYVVVESWLNALANDASRGQLLSIYFVIHYVAASGGQLLLGLRDPAASDLFIIVALFYCLSLVPVACHSGEAASARRPPGLVIGALCRLAPAGVACCVASGLMTSAFYSLAPVFADERHLSVEDISYFMSAAVFGGVVFQWPIGSLSDRIDRRLVSIAIAVFATLASLALIADLQLSRGSLIAIAFLFGGFTLAIYPIGVAAANDRLAPEEMVKASGALILAASLGSMLGPVSAAALMHRCGPGGLFVFTSAVAAGLAAFTLLRLIKRPGKSARVLHRPGEQVDLQ